MRSILAPENRAAQQRSAAERAFEAFARTVVRLRWPVVALAFAAVALTSATLPSLGSEVNNENSAFLPASSPSSKATELAAPLLGGKHGSQIVVVASRAGGLNAADAAALARDRAAAAAVPKVLSVRALGVSADREAAELGVRVAVARNDINGEREVVGALESALAKGARAPGLELHLAGQVVTAVANQKSSNRAGGQVQLFSILFIIVLLGFVFRAPLAAITTLLPSGLALAVSMRLIGGLGASGLKISSVTQVLLIVLLLGAGTDYGLFLVFRTREELRDGHDRHEAVVRALVRVGESITASAGTVIVALLTLLLASFGLYHDLGVPLAVGVAVMLLFGLTLLPALLAIFGERAFWPVRIVVGPQPPGRWARVTTRLVRHPARTLAAGVALFLALAAGALGYTSSGFGGATTAPSGSSAAAGNSALREHFPQSSANPANLVLAYSRPVWDQPQALVRAYASLHASGAFTTLAGPLQPNGTALTPAQYTRLHTRLGAPALLPVIEPAGLSVPSNAYNAYRASAQFVSADGRIVQFEAALRVGAQSSTAAMTATPRIRAVVSRAAAASAATDSGVAGEAAALYDVSTTANADLQLIVPVAAVAIMLLLALVLRSLVAPLYLIVSVVLSYLAALGLATLVFVTIGGERGLVFILPFLMFIFLLALGEDYNILVMTRIREEAARRELREAVIHAIGRTGSTVTSAGIILGGTFAVFGIFGGGSGGELHAIGFGLAAGILMDTFLVRTLLVPSAVILLGRRNWWPSRLAGAPEPGEPAVHAKARGAHDPPPHRPLPASEPSDA